MTNLVNKPVHNNKSLLSFITRNDLAYNISIRGSTIAEGPCVSGTLHWSLCKWIICSWSM